LDFIERLLGVAPDGGSGSLEWALLLVPIKKAKRTGAYRDYAPDACPTETAGPGGDHLSLVRWLDEIDRPNGLGSRGPRSGSRPWDQGLPDNAA